MESPSQSAEVSKNKQLKQVRELLKAQFPEEARIADASTMPGGVSKLTVSIAHIDELNVPYANTNYLAAAIHIINHYKEYNWSSIKEIQRFFATPGSDKIVFDAIKISKYHGLVYNLSDKEYVDKVMNTMARYILMSIPNLRNVSYPIVPHPEEMFNLVPPVTYPTLP